MSPTGVAVAVPAEKKSRAAAGHTQRRDIQGLRAVAVVVVILDHAIGWPSGGFVGVDVFFVLSGFLITGLLLREHDRSGRISIADFYRRRARRILPVSLLVLTLTVAVAALVFLVPRFLATVVDALWALVFAINWHLALVGTDYMQAAGPVSPLQHYWSLAVEEQFYLLWPLVMIAALVITRAVSKRRIGTGNRITRRGVFLVLAALTAASFAWAMYESVASPTFAYFSTFSRAWELGAGALLALVAARLTRLTATARIALAWAGLAGIAASLFLLTPESTFPAPWAALPVLATVLVVASGIGIEARRIGVLTNPVSRYLGDISYSLYLWHFPVIVFTGVFLPLTDPLVVALVLGLTLGLSMFSYHFVEEPIRTSAWLEPRSRRRARVPASARQRARRGAAWIGALAVVSIVVMALAISTRGALRVPPAEIVVAPQIEVAEGIDTALDVRGAEIVAALSTAAWPATEPAIDLLDKNAGAKEWVEDQCLNIYPNVRDSCIYGDPDAEKLAVLLGDSTAVSYLPGLLPVLEEEGYRTHVLTMFSCPAWDVSLGPAGSEAARVCDLHHDWVFDYVQELAPDMVLMSSLAGNVVKLKSDAPAEQAVIEYEEAAEATLAELAGASSDIVVISPPPAQEKPVAECKTPTSAPASCVYAPSSLFQAVVAAETQATATLGGSGRYLDVTPWLCNRGGCPAFLGTAPVSWDGIHLTDAASEDLAPLFAEALFPESAAAVSEE